MILPRGAHTGFQDFQPQLFAERTHFDHQTAGQPRAHAIVEAFEVGGCPIGRNHDLTAGIDQRIERVAELGLGRLALEKLQIVDHQHVDAAQRLLERERRLGAQRRDEPVHELLGREVEHLAVGALVAGPGDGLEQVGLAETDAGMDVERIEHHRLATARRRHLFRRGMRQRVGAADDEAFECQPQVERRTAERVVPAGNRRISRAQVADVEPRQARIAAGVRELRLLGLGLHGADDRAADVDVDLLNLGRLLLPASKNPVDVVRLNPALEEARGHREPRRDVFDAFQFHAGEPALEHVLTDFSAETLLHSPPALLIRVGHFIFALVSDVELELGETATALQAAQTVTRLRTQNSVLNLAEGANRLVGPENDASCARGSATRRIRSEPSGGPSVRVHRVNLQIRVSCRSKAPIGHNAPPFHREQIRNRTVQIALLKYLRPLPRRHATSPLVSHHQTKKDCIKLCRTLRA